MCPGEGDSEVEYVELAVFLLLLAILSAHAGNPGLELLLNSLHDHAYPADLALSGHQLHFIAALELLPH